MNRSHQGGDESSNIDGIELIRGDADMPAEDLMGGEMPYMLEKEIETYEAHKEKLLATAEGQYAHVTAEEVIGTFSTRDDALAVGYRRFLEKPFLVRQILRVQPRIWYFMTWVQ
jgi:hypothetical protein